MILRLRLSYGRLYLKTNFCFVLFSKTAFLPVVLVSGGICSVNLAGLELLLPPSQIPGSEVWAVPPGSEKQFLVCVFLAHIAG